MPTFALYDLDRTVLRRASFTPFLLFAARRRAPLRLVLAPIWLLAMAGYKAGVGSRAGLKQFGLRLFLGGRLREADLAELGEAFADKVVPAWLAPGATRTIEADRAAGHEIALVTAAMAFYAQPIARRLGIGRVLATPHRPIASTGRCVIGGANCYGAEKVARVEAMLEEAGIARDSCRLMFYSDSASDAPLFDYSDDAVLVDAGSAGRRRAAREGWRVAIFRR